jgi:hypothetical protein
LSQPVFHHLDDERFWNRLARWELNGALCDFVLRKLIGEGSNEVRAM